MGDIDVQPGANHSRGSCAHIRTVQTNKRYNILRLLDQCGGILVSLRIIAMTTRRSRMHSGQDVFSEVLGQLYSELEDEDVDYARGISACAGWRPSRRMVACDHVAANPRLNGIQLNYWQGRCAEERLLHRLCSRHFDVSHQVRRTSPGGTSVLDLTSAGMPHARKSLPRSLENKRLQVSSYLDKHGNVDKSRLTRRVREHIAQVRRQPLGTIRLVYQLAGGTPAQTGQAKHIIYQTTRAARVPSTAVSIL